MYLDSAWAVLEGQQPQRSAQPVTDRVAKLRAATGRPCMCGGIWRPGAAFILQHHGENVNAFCTDILNALTLGAARGVNIAIVGPPGCGKSIVLEPLGEIYHVVGKPERDNSFPLSGVLKAEVLL